jgi:hypothetical protein
MMRMGPEALLVKSKMDPRAELAEYARLEYSCADVHAIEARIRTELEYLPVRRSVGRRFLRWGQRRLRGEEDRAEAGRTVAPHAVEIAAAGSVQARALSGATLAAMPAMRAGSRPERMMGPISAAPILGRA